MLSKAVAEILLTSFSDSNRTSCSWSHGAGFVFNSVERIHRDELLSVVALYKSLGGRWQS